MDLGSTVSRESGKKAPFPFRFTGKIKQVTIETK
jgi:hypothetical protein